MLKQILEEFTSQPQRNKHTYIGENGLLYCEKHNLPVQTKLKAIPSIGIEEKIVNCVCAGCRAEQEEKEKETERVKLAEKYRKSAFVNTNMSKWTFENDDGLKPQISKAMQEYANNFKEFKKDGRGLVLYGNCGTGKTYMAACIANRLIDKGYKPHVTNIATLINQMQETFEDRQKFIDGLNKYELLVIDDLGTESNSAYRQEIVFNIIDSRYRAGLPLIVTTNLTAGDFKQPKNIEFDRSADRLMERCTFIEMAGASRRREMFKHSQIEGKKRLGL